MATFEQIKNNLKIHYCEMDWERFEELKKMVVDNSVPIKKVNQVRIEFKYHRMYLYTNRANGKAYIEVECFPCNKFSLCPHKLYYEKDIRNLTYNEFMNLLYIDLANTLVYDLSQKAITEEQALSLAYNRDE